MEESPEDKKKRKNRENVARWREKLKNENPEKLKRIKEENLVAHKRRIECENPDQIQKRRAANLLSQKKRIENETTVQTEARRAMSLQFQRISRENETEEQTQARRTTNLQSQTLRLLNETPDQTEARRAECLQYQRNRRENETEEQTQARRTTNLQSQTLRLSNETPDQAEARRAECLQYQRNRRENETEKQTQERRVTNLQSQTLRLLNETPDQAEARREECLKYQRNRRENETEEQTQSRRAANLRSKNLYFEKETLEQTKARREADLNAHNKRYSDQTQLLIRQAQSQTRYRNTELFNSDFEINENDVDNHSCGPLNVICNFCGSKNFKDERPSDGLFTSCCRKGRVKLEKIMDENLNVLEYPDFLIKMMTDPNDINYKNFRENIRSYNSALSFASMGAKVENFKGNGPYVFKVHGQIYHRTSHLIAINNTSPQYAQLYVIDSSQAVDIRLQNPSNINCRREILHQIDNFMRRNNRLADAYRMLKEIENQAQNQAHLGGSTIPTVNMAFRRDRHSDMRRYNTPTSNEIAMVFVNDDGEPPFERDIRVYPKNPENSQQPFININILSPNLDPMAYPLLFPYGEAGWQPNWTSDSYEGAQQNRVRNKISKLQYVAAQCAIRNEFNPRLRAGRLSQQWIVDSYLQIEANNLNYIRQNQKKLRTEHYKGLVDHLESAAQDLGTKAGVPVILPSSFEGSPRNMRERCADAMSIFSKFGAPDLFITFTANPQWQEIKENLFVGEVFSDRPDLISRVFKLKLKSLLNDLNSKNVLGVSVAHVYTIEFQKRGLPHAHILLTLRQEDKFTNVEKINEIVSAEIPNESSCPRLREIVLRCMVHGPCGISNHTAPCMENGVCKKSFPKQFQETTLLNIEGYPKYRRRAGITGTVRGKQIDNRNIVPYNPYLSLKYNAHINVEVCTSLKAVKYIYKYIYKGFDCCNLQINQGDTLKHDELSNYIDARYVSAPEAVWRIFESKMHDRSHSLIRLPVHLPNQQKLMFEEGHEEEALNAAESGKTKLEAWFILNSEDVNARDILYNNIPYHYTFYKSIWKPRKRGCDKIVSRLYTVSVKDEERFYLRLLLLHVPGATSFEYLRTFNNVVYESFKVAAFQRHLLNSDLEWDNCLMEATTFQMPKQMRETFSYICIFCIPTNPLELWNKYKYDLALDYAQNYYEQEAVNLALHDINRTLKQHGSSCSKFNLPEPEGSQIELQIYNTEVEKIESDLRIESLNVIQRNAFDQIISSLTDNDTIKCFFIDGPGGSGKTYLYATLLSYFRSLGHIALPYATTGIAATLLKGGRTYHSGFQLRVPIDETSVSRIKLNSPEAQNIREAKLIIIDEISMMTKDGLSAIDRLLKDIMSNTIPFGAKLIVIGGDFRQTLPVIPKGTRADIIEKCIKSSSLWRYFKKLTLVSNMRSENQTEYNDWLLSLGSGTLTEVETSPLNSIIIPSHLISNLHIVEAVYGNNIKEMAIEDVSKRIILAPTNQNTLQINRQIILKLEGELHTYYSSDSIVSEDPSDSLNYPPEFLHELTPSGMPPHQLDLKVGVPVMLLRNLNPKQGLCNGTRLIIKSLQNNFIEAEIISECNKGEVAFIPRIDLAPSDVNLPFILKRRQFPIIPAYAITINKSQGQTYEHVGVYLQEPVFAHGQLYVALSRSKNPSQISVSIKNTSNQGNLIQAGSYTTQNIVFKEVFTLN